MLCPACDHDALRAHYRDTYFCSHCNRLIVFKIFKACRNGDAHGDCVERAMDVQANVFKVCLCGCHKTEK